MDSTEFLPTVNWETNVYDVVSLTEETELAPATWKVSVRSVDLNDLGSDIPIEKDFYLVDNAGHTFRIIEEEVNSVVGDIAVSDDFRCGWCPQPDLTAFICKSVGNGVAPHITPAMLDRLDERAKDYLAGIEKDILWKYPKDINEKWHPDGLVFSGDATNNKVINWTGGKFFITLWPDNLVSDYLIDNVITKSAYHPERVLTVASGAFTCADDDLVYIYAKIPVDKNVTTATILIEKTYRFERYYTDYLTVLMGVYNIPDENGVRVFTMQWGGGSANTQIQSDWNQTNNSLADYIKNKPTIPDSSQFQVHIRFEAIGAKEFECPYACVFTAMIHQQTNAPTLSTALNTNMAQYDVLTVTADAVGLVTLTGTWL